MSGLNITSEQWTARCLSMSLIGLACGLALGAVIGGSLAAVAFGLFGAMLGNRVPNLQVGQAITGRQKQIVRALPDVLDLLTVSVQAGLGFDAAMLKVTEKMKGPLSDELQQVLREIKAGMLRKDALSALTARTGVSELNSFVSAIVQADQLGVSVSRVLEVQSASVREARSRRAEEEAAKAPVKMLLPMIGFIFPALFIVILGPAVIQIMETLG